MKRFVLYFVLLLGACSSDTPPLTISDIVINKPMPGMQVSAGYFTLTNNASQPVLITRVTSPQFESVEMHESVVEDGMARMYELSALNLLPNSTIEFVPGGKHLMLMNPVAELESVTLEFYAGPAVVLTIDVVVSE